MYKRYIEGSKNRVPMFQEKSCNRIPDLHHSYNAICGLSYSTSKHHHISKVTHQKVILIFSIHPARIHCFPPTSPTPVYFLINYWLICSLLSFYFNPAPAPTGKLCNVFNVHLFCKSVLAKCVSVGVCMSF
jgi:hypothetical protein